MSTRNQQSEPGDQRKRQDEGATMHGLPSNSAATDDDPPSNLNIRELQSPDNRRGRSSKSPRTPRGSNFKKSSPSRSSSHHNRRRKSNEKRAESRSNSHGRSDDSKELSPTRRRRKLSADRDSNYATSDDSKEMSLSPRPRKSSADRGSRHSSRHRSGSRHSSRPRRADVELNLTPRRKSSTGRVKSSPRNRSYSADGISSSDRRKSADKLSKSDRHSMSRSDHGGRSSRDRRNSGDGKRHSGDGRRYSNGGSDKKSSSRSPRRGGKRTVPRPLDFRSKPSKGDTSTEIVSSAAPLAGAIDSDGESDADSENAIQPDVEADRMKADEEVERMKDASARNRSSSRNRSSKPAKRTSTDTLGSMAVLTESDDDSDDNSDHAILPDEEAERMIDTSNRSRSSSRHRTSKPAKRTSTDTLGSMAVLTESDGEADDNSERAINPETQPASLLSPSNTSKRTKASRKKSKSSRGSLESMFSPSSATVATSMTSATTSTLYGNADEDVKAKAKASKGSFPPATVPGVQFTPSYSAVSKKAKVPKESLEHFMLSPSGGATVATNMSAATTSTLYGNGDEDAKAKAKASRGSSQYASNPGVESVSMAASVGGESTSSSAVGTLYGSDADAKAKARAGRGGSTYAANPGVERVALTAAMGPVAENVDEEKGGEEPVARPVSIGGTDSESDSHPIGQSQIHNDDQRKKEEKKEGKKKRRRGVVFCLLCCFLLLGAGIAVWFFVFRNDGSDQDSQINTSGIQDPSTAPSSQATTIFAPGPSGSVPGSPTGAPVLEELLFEPPSQSNCDAIAKNETIAGRDELDNADFGLGLEVVLSENTTMTRSLVDDLLIAIQEKILPSIAGCNIRADEFVEAWRFVIFDAFVSGNAKPDETCKNEELVAQNCHRVNVQLDVFLKGVVRFLDIIRLISDEEVNIANNLELSDPFSIIQLVEIDSLTPTNAPTTMPSDAPSSSPSKGPTSMPTSLPTRSPSKSPTQMPTVPGQTRVPSVEPSLAPSASPTATTVPTALLVVPTAFPTEGPSSRPSMAPIVGPTPPPTKSPTKNPTESPSTLPSMAPVVGPTPPPTKNPTKFPTVSPSARPSKAPVVGPTPPPTKNPSKSPTVFPSAMPSPRPTPFPTVRPSATPSKSPTKTPSAAPTKPPTKRPTEAPTKRPSTSPSSKPSSSPSTSPIVQTVSFVVLAEGSRCPQGGRDTFFSVRAISSLEECFDLCVNAAGCSKFSYSESNSGVNCGGATTMHL